jgi:hypothetical protein
VKSNTNIVTVHLYFRFFIIMNRNALNIITKIIFWNRIIFVTRNITAISSSNLQAFETEDIGRAAFKADSEKKLLINFLPNISFESIDKDRRLLVDSN